MKRRLFLGLLASLPFLAKADKSTVKPEINDLSVRDFNIVDDVQARFMTIRGGRGAGRSSETVDWSDKKAPVLNQDQGAVGAIRQDGRVVVFGKQTIEYSEGWPEDMRKDGK